MYPKLQEVEWLREEYVEKRQTLQQIADAVGCTKHSVMRALKRHGIERRKHTSKFYLLNDKDWLYNAYVVEKRSAREIAREVGSTSGNVQSHLSSFGIRTRSPREDWDLRNPDGAFGENAANWRGGRVVRNGYIMLYAPWHPKAKPEHPYVQEHRLVMEEQLGRFLEPYEVVHHRDGDRQNNDPSNLEVKTRGKHVSDHFKASHEVLQLREEVALLKQQVQELEAQLERNAGRRC